MIVREHSTFYWDNNTNISLFLDINECAAQVNPCNTVANSECKNTDGSYNCQCKNGFVKNGPNCEGATQFCMIRTFSFFSRLLSGQNTTNLAIWLVPAVGEIFPSCWSQQAKSSCSLYFRKRINANQQCFAFFYISIDDRSTQVYLYSQFEWLGKSS